MSKEILLKGVRIAFAQGLFNATKFDPKDAGAKAKFRATFLVEPGSENDKLIREAVKEVAVDLWKEKASTVVKSISGNPQKFFYQDGNNKDYDGFKGMMSLSASNATRPKIVDVDKKTPLVESDGRPYSGCYVNVILDVAAMTKMGNGIYAYLKGVMFAKDGDAFGGGAPLSEDAFQDLGDTGGETSGSNVVGDDFGV